MSAHQWPPRFPTTPLVTVCHQSVGIARAGLNLSPSAHGFLMILVWCQWFKVVSFSWQLLQRVFFQQTATKFNFSLHLHSISYFLCITYTIYINFIYIAHIIYIFYISPISCPSPTYIIYINFIYVTYINYIIYINFIYRCSTFTCPLQNLLRFIYTGVLTQSLLSKETWKSLLPCYGSLDVTAMDVTIGVAAMDVTAMEVTAMEVTAMEVTAMEVTAMSVKSNEFQKQWMSGAMNDLSNDISHESFVFTSSTFTIWRKSRTKASFLQLQLSVFEGSLARKLRCHIFN